MYPFFAKNIIYPLGDLFVGSSVTRYYDFMQKSQWWSPRQIRELQNSRLRQLIKHARLNVKYYRDLFQHLGLGENDIQSIDDLSKLPVLTKNEIRRNFENIQAADFKKWKPIANSTGGSTGNPLKYFITRDVVSAYWAGIFRGWGWGGFRLGDKRLKFGGSSLVPDEKPGLFEIVRDKLERNLRYSAFSMNEKRYSELIAIIQKNKPRYFFGLASATYEFAEYCKSKKINDIHFQAVFSTSEVLLPHYRRSIQNQFKCSVFDQYGSYDGGGQAIECSVHEGLHITAEKVIYETLDDKGLKVPAGTPGRLIVTDLYNYAFPFIRYDVGDIGVMTDKLCSCGRGLPLLKEVQGRTTDILKFSNGITLSGLLVPVIFEERPVKQYQVVQVAVDKLLLKIVKEPEYTDSDTNYIINLFKYHAGQDIRIDIEFCDSIPAEKNSKFRYVISKLQ